jgi:hypothetical protein
MFLILTAGEAVLPGLIPSFEFLLKPWIDLPNVHTTLLLTGNINANNPESKFYDPTTRGLQGIFRRVHHILRCTVF